MSLLKNKITVVTGGSSGIGLATAERFAEQGAYIHRFERSNVQAAVAV